MTNTPITICPDLLSSRLPTALSLLANSLAYANDVAGDRWDFAVSMAELSAIGVTIADCRWLNRKGYIDARGNSRHGTSSRRRTTVNRSATISSNSWFVLTALGNEFLQSFQRGEAPLAIAAALDDAHAVSAERRPRWVAERHELWLGSVLIKQFRTAAPNQEIILAVFQELGWPECIDDPLRPKHGLDSKRRLHDTIKTLNRNQKRQFIRFSGNGDGSSIRWELVPR